MRGLENGDLSLETAQHFVKRFKAQALSVTDQFRSVLLDFNLLVKSGTPPNAAALGDFLHDAAKELVDTSSGASRSPCCLKLLSGVTQVAHKVGCLSLVRQCLRLMILSALKAQEADSELHSASMEVDTVSAERTIFLSQVFVNYVVSISTIFDNKCLVLAKDVALSEALWALDSARRMIQKTGIKSFCRGNDPADAFKGLLLLSGNPRTHAGEEFLSWDFVVSRRAVAGPGFNLNRLERPPRCLAPLPRDLYRLPASRICMELFRPRCSRRE